MPLDGKGNFRHNDQVARLHGGGKSREQQKDEILSGKKAEPGTAEEGEGGEHTEVHNHGDGTFHTIHGGEREEHETIGHMHAHLSKLHGAEGEKHFHAHHDGFEGHSHSVETHGEPEHRQNDEPEGMKEHLQEAMGGGDESERGLGEMDSAENTLGSLKGGSALGM